MIPAILNEFGLSEVVAKGLQTVLNEHLKTVVTELNTALAEYEADAEGGPLQLEAPAQVLDRIGSESDIEGGMPLVGIAELPAEFEDDLVQDLTAAHAYYVHVVVQHSDSETLSRTLRRYRQAMLIALQRDRIAPLQGGTPVLSREGLGVWALMFKATAPGPMLGERDPDSPDGPPNNYLSWDGFIVTCKREEV